MTGTIAQKTNNGLGVTGLAYGVQIMPLRVLDENGDGGGSDIARGIRYAAQHGADVVNMSVEFDAIRHGATVPDVIKAHPLRAAEGRGDGRGRRQRVGTSRVAYPARAASVISVGATT